MSLRTNPMAVGLVCQRCVSAEPVPRVGGSERTWSPVTMRGGVPWCDDCGREVTAEEIALWRAKAKEAS